LIADHDPELRKRQILAAGTDGVCGTLEPRYAINLTSFFAALIAIVR
jgi:hypothetical protein